MKLSNFYSVLIKEQPPGRPAFPCFYGWVIVGIAFTNMCMTRGISSSFSVFFVAILNEYHWNRADLSGVFSTYMFLNFSTALIIGLLLDRLSARIVIPLGAVISGAGLVAASRSTELWHLYLWYGILASMGACAFGWVPNASALRTWFHRKLGMAQGITNAGIGLGMLMFIPLCQALIQRFGWRNTYLILAGTVWVLIVPLNWLLQKNRPQDMGMLPDGIPPSEKPTAKPFSESNPLPDKGDLFLESSAGWSIRQAMSTWAFWMLAIAFFCNPLVNFGLLLHQMAYVLGKGFDPLYAAGSLGLIGFVNSGGMILFGSISDRMGREMAFTLSSICLAAGVIALGLLEQTRGWALWAYVILAGLGQGAGATLFPPMVADLFRGQGFGKIMGMLAIYGGIGAAVGAWTLGLIYDRTGTYQLAFFFLFLTLVVAVASVWAAAPRRGPLKSKN